MDQAQRLRNVVKLRNQHLVPNAKVLTVTSGKGGVGKSNVAVNLAVQFRKAGKRVIIFDADFGLANVEVMFGTVPQYNLSDLVYGDKDIREIITKGPMDIGFISGGSGIVSLNNLKEDQISYMIHNLTLLNNLCDVLIIDTGAGIGESVTEFVLASPEVILVSTPEPSSITDSYSLMKALYRDPRFRREGTNIHLLANKVDNIEEGKALYEKLSSVVSRFLDGKIDYLGMIPLDPQLERAVRSQKIVSMAAPQSHAARAFSDLAGKLMGEEGAGSFQWGIAQLFHSFIHRR